jgi:hypothetical protein
MLLPSGFFPEDFALKATNFYSPKQNFAPSIPLYHALMAGDKLIVLQDPAVFDSGLFAKMGLAALGGGEGEVILYARHGVSCTSLAPAGSRARKRSSGGVVT